MGFKEAFDKKNFVVTVEVPPPKGTNVIPNLDIAKRLLGRVDGINVTDNQRGIMRMCPLAFSHLLKEMGHNPIMQICARDRNRLALQSDILGASALGIENICIMTGDHPKLGDHPDAKPVFDIDSIQLIKVVKELENGFSMAGKKIDGAPKFLVGGVVNPFFEPFELELIKLEKKIGAGAEFFQTQPFFERESLERFFEKVSNIDTKFLIGVSPLKSVKMISFLNEKVLARKIPENIAKRIEASDNQIEEGVRLSAEFIREIKGIINGSAGSPCRGIHIMPIGIESHLPHLLKEAGL
ncbi:MAG: methylenetetrahydrofolate reductase [Nitrospinae bacterium]|nr:methylenetetrahydrofolate reductase [Nitrospinota bacterium]